MKKLFALLFVFATIKVSAQNLDTVIVRNLQLQAQDWAWLVGSYPNINGDSATTVTFRRLRDKIRAANPTTWTTNVTIDSLPGKVVFTFYQLAKTSNAGEIVSRYTAITSSISAKTNLAYWIGYFDAVMQSDFDRKRDKGKNIVMDN
jgi:hypothetical protein